MRFKFKVKERIPNIFFGIVIGIMFGKLYQWNSCLELEEKPLDRIQNRNLKNLDTKSEEGDNARLKDENHQIPDPLQEVSSQNSSSQVHKISFDNIWRVIKESENAEMSDYNVLTLGEYDVWKNSTFHKAKWELENEWVETTIIVKTSPYKTIGSENNISMTRNSKVWDRFQLGVSNVALYDSSEEDQSMMRELLESLASTPLNSIEQFDGGTQFKLLINLNNGGKAMFKPMRFPRSQGTLPNHYQFNDFERHTAEIAAFHLDRLLVSL